MSSKDSYSDDEITKNKADQPVYFTEHGKYDDELTIEFDDKRKLFVSKNFLRHVSPAFEAMFNHDFVENRNNHLELPGKSYEDFLEFLLCIYPRTLKSVTETNVLQVVSVADEYQVTPIVTKCKEAMKAWILKSVERARSQRIYYLNHVKFLRQCLVLVTKASELNYDDVVTTGVQTIAKFGHPHFEHDKGEHRIAYYSGMPNLYTTVNDETLGEIKEKCMKLFDELPAEIRCRILFERLRYFDDMSLKK